MISLGRVCAVFLCGAAAHVVSCAPLPPRVSPAKFVDDYRRPEPIPSTAPLFAPRKYSAAFASAPITLDGRIDDPLWQSMPWSDEFLDIEGPAREHPAQRTRVKMLWDEQHLYIAADLEETDLWATLTQHDEIVFHDNDFEVFVDPDGDTREYYEIEVNAIETIFDLYLPVPYRAGAKADHGWTATGMQVAIHRDGTLNDSRDIDRGWTVEMAIPWSVFTPVARAGTETFQHTAPHPDAGDVWRINFSRVQWTLEKQGDSHAKVAGKPEHNWTWTPQWIIDMHVPQYWGFVTFASAEVPLKESLK
ncbi:MAG: hypothetical protein EXS15_06985 [Phycisphaerales bacterium]|nr:hypothetical protein [Phycisphaerales bacterium]